MQKASPDWASIIPLDYSKRNHPRVEFSILLFSTNWESLLPLIEDPVGTLACRGREWKQKSNIEGHPDVPWELDAPAVIQIEPAVLSLLAMSKAAEIHGLGLKEIRQSAVERLRAMGHDFGQFVPSQDSQKGAQDTALQQRLMLGLNEQAASPFVHEELVKALHPHTTAGAYLAAFAPWTHLLQIYYWPPEESVRAASDSAVRPRDQANRKRHRIPYTKATIGMIATTGELHFDIGVGPANRADFILDHIENSAQTYQALNNLEVFHYGQTEFAPRGGTVNVDDLQEVSAHELPITAPVVSTSVQPQPGVSAKHVALATHARLCGVNSLAVVPPSVCVAMDSETSTTNCCCVGQATQTDSTIVADPSLTAKIYTS